MATKLIAVLHGDLPDVLRTRTGWLRSLHGAGCTSVQLNIDDAAVAPAFRFGPGDDAGRAVTALVSAWTEDVDATSSLLSDLGADLYRVTEHRRLDPPRVADGERADALANVALLRRPATMSREDYLDRWLVHHTPIAIRTQATFGYVQNVVEEPLTSGAPAIAAIVEELFPVAAMTDTHAFYGSDGDDLELNRRISELMASCATFGADTGLDLVPTSRYLWTSLPA